MKGSWIKYLGLLGLLGFLGFLTENKGFYGFFGFFGFFSYKIRDIDERFDADINRSARNSFLVSIIVFAVGITAGTLSNNREVFVWAFALSFALQMLVFSLSMGYYDRKGSNI